MLILILAVAFLILGAKAFTRSGLPLTRRTKLRGVPGMIVGTLCILVGLAGVADWFFYRYGLNRQADPPKQTPAPSEQGRKPSVTVLKDESLTPAEYERLGLPGLDREWSSDDMTEAAKVLTAVAERNSRNLPRYNSKQSGEVFARLTSAQCLALLRSAKTPLDSRLTEALKFMKAANQLLSIYLTAWQSEAVNESEFFDLMSLQLKISVVALGLADERFSKTSKDDPIYQRRFDGQQKVLHGCFEQVQGGLGFLEKRQSYDRIAVARLIGHLQETLPEVVPQLAADAQSEVVARLEKMQADTGAPAHQAALRELTAKVKVALKEARPRQ